jgi:hypothetical protein
MRIRNTVILIVVAALLAGYFFLIEQPRHRRAQIKASNANDLAELDIEDAAFLSIRRSDVELSFIRRGRGWIMTSPISDVAEDGSVNRLLGVIANGEITRDLGPQEDLKPFGLDPPEAIVTVANADGDTVVSIEAGELTVDKYNAYARDRMGSRPDHVLLVPTGVRRYALTEPSDFRSKRLAIFQISSVTSFTLRWPDRTMTWRRAGDGWSTEADGREIRGRKRYVEAILRRLRGVRALEFVPEAELSNVQPFDAPPRSISVTTDDGKEATVTVGRILEGRVYAGSRLADEVQHRVVLTDTTLLQIFDSTVDDLRDRRLLRFDRARLGKITLESPDVNATLVRPGNEWGFPNPAAGRIDQTSVTKVLDAIANLEYARVIDEVSKPLSNPDLRLTIFDEDGERIDQLSGKASESTPSVYIVTSEFSRVVAEIPASELDEIKSRFENLRKP